MWLLAFIRFALGVLSLRGARWAYVAFVVLGLLYFPAKVGFRLDPHPCQLTFGISLAIHWSGEEQGLNGSGAFAADHPKVVSGLQILINQDSGTGRVVKISMQGFTGAGAFFRRWLSQMPNEISRQISLVDPGTPNRGTDNASFNCYGAPAFELSSQDWDYETYTMHTNRDTFDKLVFDDLKSNAALVAMLAYLASEDPQRVPREPRVTATNPRQVNPPLGRPASHRYGIGRSTNLESRDCGRGI